MRILKLTVAIGIAAGFGVSYAPGAFAQKGMQYGGAAQWAVQKVDSEQSPEKSYCVLANKYPQGAVLTVAKNTSQEATLGLDFKTDVFTPGGPVNVVLDPGAGQQRSYKASPTSLSALVVRMGADEAFFKALQRTGYLRAEIDGESYSFNLANIDEAKLRLDNCLFSIPRAAPVQAQVVPVVPAVPVPGTMPGTMQGGMPYESLSTISPVTPVSPAVPVYDAQADMKIAALEDMVRDLMATNQALAGENDALSAQMKSGALQNDIEVLKTQEALRQEEVRRAQEALKMQQALKSQEALRLEEAQRAELALQNQQALRSQQAVKEQELQRMAEALRAQEVLRQDAMRKAEEALQAQQALKAQQDARERELLKMAAALKAQEELRAQEARRVEEALRAQQELKAQQEAKEQELLRMAEALKAQEELRKQEALRAEQALKMQQIISAEQAAAEREVLQTKQALEAEAARKAEEERKVQEALRMKMALEEKNKQLEMERARLEAEMAALAQKATVKSQEAARLAEAARAAEQARASEAARAAEAARMAEVAEAARREEAAKAMKAAEAARRASEAAELAEAKHAAEDGARQAREIALRQEQAQMRERAAREEAQRAVDQASQEILPLPEVAPAQEMASLAPVEEIQGPAFTPEFSEGMSEAQMQEAALSRQIASGAQPRVVKRTGGAEALFRSAQFGERAKDVTREDTPVAEPLPVSQEKPEAIVAAALPAPEIIEVSQAPEPQGVVVDEDVDSIVERILEEAQAAKVSEADAGEEMQVASLPPAEESAIRPVSVQPLLAEDMGAPSLPAPAPAVVEDYTKEVYVPEIPDGEPLSLVSGAGDYVPEVAVEDVLESAAVVSGGEISKVEAASGPGAVVYQWKLGSVYGSSEQKPVASEEQFEHMVQEYLEKTQSRCEGEYAVVPAETADSPGTRVDTYEIACVGRDVSSSASLLFVKKGGTFTAVAHEAPVEEMDTAMALTDRLSSAFLQ